MSKTQQALQWLRENPTETRYAAAIKFGLSQSTVWRAVENEKKTASERCPCCGQVIRK